MGLRFVYVPNPDHILKKCMAVPNSSIFHWAIHPNLRVCKRDYSFGTLDN